MGKGEALFIVGYFVLLLVTAVFMHWKINWFDKR